MHRGLLNLQHAAGRDEKVCDSGKMASQREKMVKLFFFLQLYERITLLNYTMSNWEFGVLDCLRGSSVK